MAVPDLAVAISNATGSTFPYEFPAICAHLQTVAVVAGFILVAHETQKCHVDRGHAKLECFEVKAEIFTETMEYLINEQQEQHY